MLGLAIGSFAATLVLRWVDGRSVAQGRSACDSCHAPLGVPELIPLLSWLRTRGKCRRCGAAIDPLHPLTEVAAMAIGTGAGFLIPGPASLALAAFGWLLLTLALLDARALWLPDRLTLPLALGGVLLGGMALDVPLTDRLIGGAAGFGVLALIALGYRVIRHRQGLGGGDPKLLGAIGLWMGWQALPLILLGAAFAGLAVAALRLARSDDAGDWRTQQLPFGTLLVMATLVLIGTGWRMAG